MGAAEAAAPDAAPVPRREYAVDLACSACEAAVHAALKALPGVTRAAASAAAQTVVVDGDAAPEAVLAALAATGRAARLVGQGAADGTVSRMRMRALRIMPGWRERGAQSDARASAAVFARCFAAVPSHVGPAEENAACVAEFKGAAHGTGPLRGVVRVAQLTGTQRSLPFRVSLSRCSSG